MNQPLKELIFEKVEDSYTFKQDLKDAILEIELIDPENGVIEMSDKYADEIASELLATIADFVNQNYTPKKDKI